MNYLFVYIRQAHSEDWPIGAWSQVPQPKNMEERIRRGLKFKEEYNMSMPVVFDTMDDNFNNIAKAWPHRMYVVSKKGTTLYIEPDSEDGIERTTKLENLLEYLEK